MLDEAIMYLIQNKPFYAHLVMGMRKEFTDRVPTAGVNITDKVNLLINPNFWKSMNAIEQAAILEHECLHVVMNHFKRREHRKPRLYNIAADMAINEYIKGLPREINVLDKQGKPVLDKKTGQPLKGKTIFPADYKLPSRQTSEFYYEELQKQQKEKQDQGEPEYQPGQDTIDDHDCWDESIDNDEVIEEKIKNLVKPAMEEARKAGNMPSEITKLIERLFHKPKDWRKDLQKFAAKNVEVIGDTSRKVRNRRYGIIFPGYIKKEKLKLVVAVDTSGSVSQEEQTQFMAEIHKIYQQGATIYVMEADAAVHNVYEYDPKKPVKFKGGGGTAFGPVFEKANELNPDGLIYMTDGDDWGTEAKKPSYPVMWALLKGRDVRYKWGMKTWIEVKKK